MAHFLDSNVIIGYIFDNADTQGKYAKIVMRIPEEKHSGQTVKNECFGFNENGRCQTVKSDITREFRRVIAALNRGSEVSEILEEMEKINTLDNKRCRTCIIIRDIAEKYNGDAIRLASVLRTSQRNFDAGCLRRRDDVDKKIIFHERDLSYTDIYNTLKEYIEDMDDIEVIIDAHHVGLDICNLVLVSGDKDVTSFEELIRKVTSITDVKRLSSFADYVGIQN